MCLTNKSLIRNYWKVKCRYDKFTLTSSKTEPVFTTREAAVEAGVNAVMENPRGPIGGEVVVVVVVTGGVTSPHGEGRMKLSPSSPQFAIGCDFQDHMDHTRSQMLWSWNPNIKRIFAQVVSWSKYSWPWEGTVPSYASQLVKVRPKIARYPFCPQLSRMWRHTQQINFWPDKKSCCDLNNQYRTTEKYVF